LLQSEFKQAAEATGTWHAVIRNGLGQAIATGYLVTLPGNTANIDGLVTEPVLRSQGLGAHIVSALSVAAHERGYRQVSVSAPGHVRGYFEKLGFTVAHTRLVGDETHILVMSKDSQS
jgi:N-acetylglutamate synthase-like GNAT family acetyltransferase